MSEATNDAVVEIIIRGGLVETVKAPPGTTVHVFDYDVEGTEITVQTDPDGEDFIEFIHPGTGEFD